MATQTGTKNKTLSAHILNIIKQDDVRKEFRNLFEPLSSLILDALTPYLYIGLLLIILLYFILLCSLIGIIQLLRATSANATSLISIHNETPY
jgi:hypothetical protein